MKSNSAVTFIEILIALALISILMGIVLQPRMQALYPNGYNNSGYWSPTWKRGIEMVPSGGMPTGNGVIMVQESANMPVIQYLTNYDLVVNGHHYVAAHSPYCPCRLMAPVGTYTIPPPMFDSMSSSPSWPPTYAYPRTAIITTPEGTIITTNH